MVKNIIDLARKNEFDNRIEIAFQNEEMDKKSFIDKLAQGKIVIPANKNRKRQKYYAIGDGCSVKINVNIGVSNVCGSFEEEIKKANLLNQFEVESCMDLSSGINADKFRKILLNEYQFVVGMVPVYDIALKIDDWTKAEAKDFLEIIEQWAEEGMDFFTIHAGINKRVLEKIKNSSRIMKMVSRGGAMIYNWMVKNGKENPLFEYFDEIVKICKKHDVVISLGDGLRPGTIYDATDNLQIEELICLGELTQIALKEGVQVMIEGPGHMRANEIAANVTLQKKLCSGVPFYVLGPLTTDIAAGYDHISGAMGALIAAINGADFLCYVTPAEHLRLPTVDDVKEGIVAFKIAAHSANISKGYKKYLEKDYGMSKARAELNWDVMLKYGIDKEKMKSYMQPINTGECSMCGKLCAVKNSSI